MACVVVVVVNNMINHCSIVIFNFFIDNTVLKLGEKLLYVHSVYGTGMP